MDVPDHAQNKPRSNFVNVVAWLFIASAGFAAVISILQNIVVNTFFPIDQMTREMTRDVKNLPALSLFMLEHIRSFLLLFLFASVATLVSSIGLLMRKNWGRISFIAILIIGILWNLSGFVFQQFFMPSMPPNLPNTPDDFNTIFDTMKIMITIFSALMVVAFTVLFGWIIKRLLSQEIRQEFL